MKRSRGIVAVVAVVAIAVIGLFGAATPALAHDGDPLIEVEEVHPLDTGVHLIVRMTWLNDGDPINDRIVTATPVGPDGVAGAMVTLTPGGDGRYEGPVEMPTGGTWTVTIASADPVGSITHTEVRPGEDPTATTAPATETTQPATSAPASSTAQDNTTTEEDESEVAVATTSSDSDSTSVLPLILAALVVAIAGGFGAWQIVKRRGGGTPPTGPGASEPDAAV